MSGISKIVTIMKKIMKPFVLVAATAMALTSCQKNEIPAPEKQDVHFTINAGIETKTSIVESTETDENGKPIYHAQWDGNEELGVLFAKPNDQTKATDVVKLTNAVSGSTASFQGNVTLDATSGTFYAFYPAAAFYRGYAEEDARLDLKNVQKPTASSFDPSCDILVAKPYTYEVVDGKVVADGLEFARLMSVLRIDLKSEFADIQNEFVESVSFTAGDVQITGYARIFLDNPKFDKWASNEAHWRTVTANYDSDLVSINGTSNSVYLVIAPVTIPANKDLTFEIKTKNYNISKTIKSPEMKFTAGKVSKINLTIAADNCDKIDTSIDYSGEWLITGVNGSQTYAVSAYVDGNNLDVLIPIAVADEKITEVDGLANCKMTITKVLDGDYAGMYTIEDANSTEQKRSYLYAAGTGTNNHLKAGSTLSAGSYWDITKNDNGTYTIIASKHTTDRNTIWYNTSNNLVSCYQSNSASYKPITLYPYSMVVPDTTPRILVEETAYNVLATDTSVEIPFTVKNITGTISATVADGATMTNANASVVGNNVKVTFGANEAAESKTATIVLSYEGAQSVNVVITQEGKPAEGDTTPKFVKVTTAPADWSGTYLIVCETQNVVFNGSLTTLDATNNTVSVTIQNGEIAYSDALNSSTFVVAKNGEASYTIQSASGYYIGRDATSNGLNANTSTKYVNTITLNSGNITIAGKGGLNLRYNKNSDQKRFRYFTSAQTEIQLYKLVGGESGGETPEPEQPTLSPRNLAFSSTTATATVGQPFTVPTLSGAKIDDVTYSSSNTGVATVDKTTGAVTLVAAGTTTIKASALATDQYEAGEAIYTLTVSAAQASAKTYTLTISSSDFNGTSYDANNTTKTSKAKATDGSEISVSWVSYQVMLQSNAMQWQKSKGYIYNTTDLGTIKSIKVNTTAGSFTQYIGASQKPTSNGSGGYFHIKTGSSAVGKTSSVVITFEK
jgi:hypothetical protein